MNKTSIKNYAIWARNELITRVTQKAFEYGVEKDAIVPFDAENINGRLLSANEKNKRLRLISEVNHKGFEQVIEEVAYTWFNRFIALRFMEVNNYLPNKVRLFTNENNEFKPQIIDEALHVDLNGLDKNKVIELKESNNNEELYKELLLATCNEMHRYLPGMFETIDDYMTLLFPNNLLREESVLGRLISDIDEDSWTDQVQIIGWLYQYYNTEPKDKTFSDLKKNIKISKEKIPSATQLFTPDWIVRYMTENSLGRIWLDGHEDKGIKANWRYYLDEVEQEESVQIELNKIKAGHAILKPEGIKFIDPCMGSGHILVYAFDVFMQIYVSEGWTEREAAKSILQNNLYGIDIDDRAYQLSYFALMMKARQYNRRILSEGIIPNVMAIQESNAFNRELLDRFGDLKSLATRVVDTFIDAKEYGSILKVEFTKEELDSLDEKLNEIDKMADYGNLLDQAESIDLINQFDPLLKQARIMSQKYGCVVTNPPYLSNGGMNDALSLYCKKHYFDAKGDLCTVFIDKCIETLSDHGYCGLITMQSWMFLTSFEKLRRRIIDKKLVNMLHLGPRAFSDISGEVVNTTSFVLGTDSNKLYKGKYYRLVDYKSEESKQNAFISRDMLYIASPQKFEKIPGAQIAYWVDDRFIDLFSKECISNYAISDGQTKTGNNDIYLRNIWEIKNYTIGKDKKWVPHAKGGTFRRWYGNVDTVINWTPEAREHYRKDKVARIAPEYIWFREGVCWNLIKSGERFAARLLEDSSTFNIAGPAIFFDDLNMNKYVIGLLNSVIAEQVINFLNPTLSTNIGDIYAVPLLYKTDHNRDEIIRIVNDNIKISKEEWDSFECSLNFKNHPLICIESNSLVVSCEKWNKEVVERIEKLSTNEKQLDKLFIQSYGLQGVFSKERSYETTLRYLTPKEMIKTLISYAVGCMFGRYSLDTEGLAYAGGEWSNSLYKSFIPDTDNIIPICDDEYFEDDIVGRFIEFIKVAYGEDTLEDNLQFIADALGGKGTSREVIRDYFMNDFYSDHIKLYQKRPIYWQFDSGKKNGFKALIYIHRYTPDLIARMRTSYVHEQQSRYANQIEMTEKQIDSASSTSERVKLEKKLKKLKDQAEEIRVYEEKIHHWADKMESMDLDDGVKANYAKFQELLAKIK